MRQVARTAGKPRGRVRSSPVRRVPVTRKAVQRTRLSHRFEDSAGFLFRLSEGIRSLFYAGRQIVLFGLLAALVCGFLLFFLSGYAHRFSAAVSRSASDLSADSGFLVSAIHLSGNHHESPVQIYRALGFEGGASIFAADPQQVARQLQNLPWIKDAEVSRRFPDVVDIRLEEKVPFGLWRSGQGLYVVDESGRPIVAVQPDKGFSRLPFFFGEMPVHGAELLSVISAHRAVSARLKAMQRVTGRRWNLVLDDGVLVKLPEDGWKREIGALERLIVDKGILERDISEIDLRSHDNYVFVLRHSPPQKSTRGEPT